MTTFLAPLAAGADNTAQINSAIQLVTSGNGAAIVMEQGLYVVEGQITINRPVALQGSGDGITTLALGTNGSIVIAPAAAGVLSFVTLSDFDIIGKNRTKRSATAIRATNMHNSTIYGITIRDHLTAIELNNTTVVTVENISVLEMTVQCTGIKINGGRDHFLNDIYIDQSTSSSGTTGGGIGIDLPYSAASWISNVDIINFDYGIRIHPGRSGQPTNEAVDWCFFSQVATDQCSIAGFYFNVGFTGATSAANRIDGVSLTNCWAGSNGVGILIEKSSAPATLDGLDFVGMKVLNNKKEGFKIGNSVGQSKRIRNIKISDCKIAGNSVNQNGGFAGVVIGDGSQNVQICDCAIGTWGGFVARQKYGIELATSSTAVPPVPTSSTSGVMITGNLIDGNVGAGVFDLVSNPTKVIRDNIGFITEYAGQTFVPTGQTEVVVNHFCNGQPLWVSVTPMDNMSNYDPPVVTAITATTFKIVLSTTAFGNKFFLFKAQVYP
jgi:Pectate lyase superfamily protein